MQYPSLKAVRSQLEAPTATPCSPQEQQHTHQCVSTPRQQQQGAGPHQLQAIISPSILAADFANLASELLRVQAGGADWVHVDMFDGERPELIY